MIPDTLMFSLRVWDSAFSLNCFRAQGRALVVRNTIHCSQLAFRIGATRRRATATDVGILWLATELCAADHGGLRWMTWPNALPEAKEAGAETCTVPATDRRSSLANGKKWKLERLNDISQCNSWSTLNKPGTGGNLLVFRGVGQPGDRQEPSEYVSETPEQIQA